MVVELSKSLPIEENNSTIKLHFSVDSQYSLPVEALNLIVEQGVKLGLIQSPMRLNFSLWRPNPEN